jgi:hypothetical protein
MNLIQGDILSIGGDERFPPLPFFHPNNSSPLTSKKLDPGLHYMISVAGLIVLTLCIC